MGVITWAFSIIISFMLTLFGWRYIMKKIGHAEGDYNGIYDDTDSIRKMGHL